MSIEFSPPAPLRTAVLFLVFNRPGTTAKVFEAIRKARPPRLYVAADAARASREGEAERVALVREIATDVDWPCEVLTLFREENLGCKYAVSDGITWFFEHEEQGIILEDDCLPNQSFFGSAKLCCGVMPRMSVLKSSLATIFRMVNTEANLVPHIISRNTTTAGAGRLGVVLGSIIKAIFHSGPNGLYQKIGLRKCQIQLNIATGAKSLIKFTRGRGILGLILGLLALGTITG